MIRSDILFSKKSLHVKLDKEQHLALREKLMRHNLTMQDFFQDAVDTVLNDGPRADNLLQKIVKKKILASLEKKTQTKTIGDIDAESLYKLLEDALEEKEK